jgi:hypothetical protein
MHRAALRAALSLIATLGLTPAQATADPSAIDLIDGIRFAQYAGTAPVGAGQVDDSGTLYWIDEKTLDGLKAWYVFHDGSGLSQVTATLDFGAPIVDVLFDRATLKASHGFAADTVRYVYTGFTGLEMRQGDRFSFKRGSSTLRLDFSTLTPGDHIRILTAVPEPGTAATLAGGLAALLWLARRRRPGA